LSSLKSVILKFLFVFGELFNVLYVKKQSKFIEFYKSVFKKFFDI